MEHDSLMIINMRKIFVDAFLTFQRWRKRWFLLTQAENIPGQYILTYYTNRNCSKHKGVINLDHCEQVDHLILSLNVSHMLQTYVFNRLI